MGGAAALIPGLSCRPAGWESSLRVRGSETRHDAGTHPSAAAATTGKIQRVPSHLAQRHVSLRRRTAVSRAQLA